MYYSDSFFSQSRHVKQRMGQRGITGEMIDLVLQHGKPQHDSKVALTQKDAQRLLTQMQHSIKVIKKILDKGGVVVVENNNTVITTYNCES